MLAASHPRQEARLAALRRYQILDTPREKEFDDITALVAAICEVPVAVINFIDLDRQWFKSEVGLGVDSTPLDTSLCSHVILERDFVEIPDTLADPRMRDNPLCTAEGGFRFYAGALLKTADGLPLGTLCVLDTACRTLTPLQRRTLMVLAHRIMGELDLRLALRQQHFLRLETDHRVKNSLASVAAIIGLQSSRSDEPAARAALDAVQARITALAALHEELHQVSHDGQIDMAALVDRAVGKLRHLIPERISVTTGIGPHFMSSEEANAVVLIVNEFITNSAKHGFADGQAGTIAIVGSVEEHGFRLVCRDDGIGDVDSIQRIETGGGLGSRIIRSLAASIRGRTRWTALDRGLQLEIAVTRAA